MASVVREDGCELAEVMPWPKTDYRSEIDRRAGNYWDPERICKGKRHRGELIATIAFDDETFAELRRMAVKRCRSFGFIVREVLEIGLETLKLDESNN